MCSYKSLHLKIIFLFSFQMEQKALRGNVYIHGKKADQDVHI